jgi:molybdopterin/thiamine biosynthesis adenylyltransferase
MGLVLFVMAVVWGVGWALKVPARPRLVMIGLIYGAVVLGHLVLPDGTELRRATGGDVRPWLVLAGIVGLVLGYRALIGRLRLRHQTPSAPPQPGAFSETELNRYARHIVLREVGGAGQRKLKSARVLVVGAGGLGSPVLLYLAAAGVGTIGVIDDDVVDGSNLQRQIVHSDARIGMPKVFSAQAALQALNPFVTVRPYHRRLDPEIAESLFADYDLILDGSDNFDTRYLVNRVAVAQGKPLISAAMTQWDGQISLYHPASGAPCYECVFPTRPAAGLAPSCAEIGVIAPLPGVIGSRMALEAVKEITGAGTSLRGRLVLFDGLDGDSRTITVARRAECACCGVSASVTDQATA